VEGRAATLTIERPATDLLTGERREGEVALKPYGVMVLKM